MNFLLKKMKLEPQNSLAKQTIIGTVFYCFGQGQNISWGFFQKYFYSYFYHNQSNFDEDDANLATIISFLITGIFGMISPQLSDYFGMKKYLRIIPVFTFISILISAFMKQYEVFCLFYIVLGIANFQLTIYPVVYCVLSHYDKNQIGKVVAFVLSLLSISSFITVFIFYGIVNPYFYFDSKELDENGNQIDYYNESISSQSMPAIHIFNAVSTFCVIYSSTLIQAMSEQSYIIQYLQELKYAKSFVKDEQNIQLSANKNDTNLNTNKQIQKNDDKRDIKQNQETQKKQQQQDQINDNNDKILSNSQQNLEANKSNVDNNQITNTNGDQIEEETEQQAKHFYEQSKLASNLNYYYPSLQQSLKYLPFLLFFGSSLCFGLFYSYLNSNADKITLSFPIKVIILIVKPFGYALCGYLADKYPYKKTLIISYFILSFFSVTLSATYDCYPVSAIWIFIIQIISSCIKCIIVSSICQIFGFSTGTLLAPIVSFAYFITDILIFGVNDITLDTLGYIPGLILFSMFTQTGILILTFIKSYYKWMPTY